jgi:hypothetical protein
MPQCPCTQGRADDGGGCRALRCCSARAGGSVQRGGSRIEKMCRLCFFFSLALFLRTRGLGLHKNWLPLGWCRGLKCQSGVTLGSLMKGWDGMCICAQSVPCAYDTSPFLSTKLPACLHALSSSCSEAYQLLLLARCSLGHMDYNIVQNRPILMKTNKTGLNRFCWFTKNRLV